MKINVKLLIATIVAGVVASALNFFLYDTLIDAIPRFVLIPILFALLAIFVCGTIFVMGLIDCDGGDGFLFLEGRAQIVAGLFTAMVLLFFGAMGLEAWYEAESEEKGKLQLPPASSYIFVLDESGSMYSNDPKQLRNTAVNSVMAALDQSTPYAVYVFGNNALSARAMKPFSEGEYHPDSAIIDQTGGGTAICNALVKVLSDYKSGAFPACGDAPRVILLSDGGDSDLVGTPGDQMISEYKNAGISISTIGLYQNSIFNTGPNSDAKALERVAKETGGVFAEVRKSSDLVQAFGNAASVNLDGGRDLFSQRNTVTSEFLYALLRVAALTLLGALVALMKACALGKEDSTALVLSFGAIASLAGALAVELLALMGAPLVIGLVIYCILVAATPSRETVVYSSTETKQLNFDL